MDRANAGASRSIVTRASHASGHVVYMPTGLSPGKSANRTSTRIPALGRRECNIGAPARCGKGSLVCVDAVCGNFDFRNATKGE